MKLVGLVILGLITSAALYLPLGMLFGMLASVVFKDIGEPGGIFLASLVIIPFSFLLGSMITGYFSYYDIENKWLLLWMSPVLYCILIWMCAAGVMFLLDWFASVKETSHTSFWNGICIPILIGLYWYLASLAGVGLGYFIRKRFALWWYGD